MEEKLHDQKVNEEESRGDTQRWEKWTLLVNSYPVYNYDAKSKDPRIIMILRPRMLGRVYTMPNDGGKEDYNFMIPEDYSREDTNYSS